MNARHDVAGTAPPLLAELHCPYCGSGTELELGSPVPSGAGGNGLPPYGILRCSCHSYPIVDGIPILQHVEGLDRITARIAEGDHPGALAEALNVFRITWARRSRLHQISYRRACRRLMADDELPFEEAVALVRQPKGFSDYLFHRWANTSFLGAAAVMSVLGTLSPSAADGQGGAPRVLDLACGAGHSSFLIRRLFPWLTVVSADHDFVSLYLARRYFGPDGLYVCTDAEVPTPFPDEAFDAVFCLDAFHYFSSKQSILRDLRRVVRRDGLWLFPHLHNALQANITPGIPLAAERYLEMFAFANPRLFGEMAILSSLTMTGSLDLADEPDLASVRQENALCLVGGRAGLWRTHAGPFDLLADRPGALSVNPIYARTATPGGVRLALTWPNPVMERECAAVQAVLPPTVELTRADLADLSGPRPLAEGSRLRQLLSRFVLVPLPPRYRRPGSDPAAR